MNQLAVVEKLERPITILNGQDYKAWLVSEELQKAQEERQSLQVELWNMYHAEGMRTKVIAEEKGISYARCLDLLNSERHKRKSQEVIKARLLFTPPKQTATVNRKSLRGLVTPVTQEAPLQERGRFLDSSEGKETLERYNQPYEPEKPEFLKLRNPPENPLLTYGGKG